MKITSDPDAGDMQNFGLLSNAHFERALPNALGMQYLEKGYDGTYSFPAALDGESDRILTDIADFYNNNEGVHTRLTTNTDDGYLNPIFSSGRALFYGQTLNQSAAFRASMKDKYGVLPLPKLNEAQLEYRVATRDTMTGVMIPYNVENIERTGVVTELLCMESRKSVVESYYSTVLQKRTFDDERCKATLDLIRNSVVLSFQQAYSYTLNYPNSLMTSILGTQGAQSPSSVYAGQQTTWNTKIIKMFETLDATALKQSD